MSKKDFERAARIVKALRTYGYNEETIVALED